jgi:hypothetical protein
MSRENTSSLSHGDGEDSCLASSPVRGSVLERCVLRGIPVHQWLCSSCRAGAPASRVAAMCQPWFCRRLEAYGFVGLSEGAYRTLLAYREFIDPKRDRHVESHLSKNERWATPPKRSLSGAPSRAEMPAWLGPANFLQGATKLEAHVR